VPKSPLPTPQEKTAGNIDSDLRIHRRTQPLGTDCVEDGATCPEASVNRSTHDARLNAIRGGYDDGLIAVE
jgi:hypothetical protein